jgi:phage terminase large subunit-like protein
MDVTRWRRDPAAFIVEVLRNPETGEPFVLYPAEEEFLRLALTPTADGALPFAELVFAAPKKSGKTAIAAMSMLYAVIVLGGRYAEGYCVANDLEQAQGRVFEACRRLVETSPVLRTIAQLTQVKITFTGTAGTISALASDYASAAGSNPTFVSFDELWAYTSERSRRLWDELVPGVPTRRVSGRLTTTYAGFDGESELLWQLYQRGLRGEVVGPSLYRQPGLLMAWHTEAIAPWQTASWIETMRLTLRPSAFLRMISNTFASAESTFVDPAWWAACEDPALHPVVANPRLPVWVGIDASVKRDSTAVVVCAWDAEAKKVWLVWHRIWQPSVTEPLDFEATVATTVRDLCRRFDVRAVKYDPFQLVAVAQRLTAEGVPMEEFPQTVSNLTESSSNLYELIKGGNVRVYRDDGLRLAVLRAVAVETARGWRIAKEKASHKIDVVVALAMAALGVVRDGTTPDFFADGVLASNLSDHRQPLLDRRELELMARDRDGGGW